MAQTGLYWVSTEKAVAYVMEMHDSGCLKNGYDHILVLFWFFFVAAFFLFFFFSFFLFLVSGYSRHPPSLERPFN